MNKIIVLIINIIIARYILNWNLKALAQPMETMDGSNASHLAIQNVMQKLGIHIAMRAARNKKNVE